MSPLFVPLYCSSLFLVISSMKYLLLLSKFCSVCPHLIIISYLKSHILLPSIHYVSLPSLLVQFSNTAFLNIWEELHINVFKIISLCSFDALHLCDLCLKTCWWRWPNDLLLLYCSTSLFVFLFCTSTLNYSVYALGDGWFANAVFVKYLSHQSPNTPQARFELSPRS